MSGYVEVRVDKLRRWYAAVLRDVWRLATGEEDPDAHGAGDVLNALEDLAKQVNWPEGSAPDFKLWDRWWQGRKERHLVERGL